MAYVSLYRTYRAQQFDQVLGQTHITTTLRNAIRQGKWSHAYLFCGPRGTGKTTTARILAKALNCEKGPTPDPCDQCRFCTAIRAGSCLDVIEIDAASETSIEDVRGAIIENAKYPPMEARFKLYIIDEAHDLSSKAFDALLKTLEEPPAHVVFVLATTEYTKVPATIRSRCQRFDFRRGRVGDLLRCLEQVVQAEGWTVEPAALHLIARYADGSWRDALTALEQVVAFGEEPIRAQTVYQALGMVEDEILQSLVEALAEGDSAQVLLFLEEQYQRGREPRLITESLLSYIRTLMYAGLQVGSTAEGYDKTYWGALYEQAVRIGTSKLLQWWGDLTEAYSQMRTSGMPRLLLELALLALGNRQVVALPAQQGAPPSGRPQPDEQREGGEQPDSTLQPSTPVLTPSSFWEAFVAELKTKSPRAAALLTSSSFRRESETRATIFLRSEAALKPFEEEKRSKWLAAQLAKALGVPEIQLQFALSPNAEPPSEKKLPPTAPVTPTLEGQALVEAIKEDFDGEEVGSR